MNHYRISKYSPEYRQNGVYLKDEWTSIADVGKTFDGVMMSIDRPRGLLSAGDCVHLVPVFVA